MSPELEKKIAQFVERHGEDLLRDFILEREDSEKVLTIICDRTMHEIPQDVLVGDVFDFSHGSLDTSSDKSLTRELIDKLAVLQKTLKSNHWKSVRLIISGHAILAPQIKMLVYRILHLETEDFGYFASVGYRRIRINFRTDLS